MLHDRVGNSLKSAYNLKTQGTKNLTLRDNIDTQDTNDLYSFRLGSRSRVDLALSGRGEENQLGLELLRLKRSGAIEQIGGNDFSRLSRKTIQNNFQRVAQVEVEGKRTQPLSLTLNPGKYYIRIFPPQAKSSHPSNPLTASNQNPIQDSQAANPFDNSFGPMSRRKADPQSSGSLEASQTSDQPETKRYNLQLSFAQPSTPSRVPRSLAAVKRADSTASQNFTPPRNPYLGRSPWPIYHRNSYAQASTKLRGPEPGDSNKVEYISNPSNTNSPWLNLSERYPNGERVVWGATLTKVFKAKVHNSQFQMIDDYQIDDRDLTINWNLLLLKGNQVFVPDPGRRRLLRFGDQNPRNPNSPIALKDTFELPANIPGSFVHMNVTYDGWIVLQTNRGHLVAVRRDFSEYRTFRLARAADSNQYGHNAFSVDEEGGLYFVSTQSLTRVNWDGNRFSLGWRIPYDFQGSGGKPSDSTAVQLSKFLRGEEGTGSGTTPTLMGFGNMDKLVLVADGKTPNNMVAFWRDKIPDDWAGLPGYDRRIAAITPLPYSTPEGEGFTAENSPTAWGYDMAIAQYNGFEPDKNPAKGVQKLRWDPTTRTLPVVWATDAVNFNNVLTYSQGSNLVYGSGRREGIYHFWGLDWETGQVKLEVPLGDSPNFLDQGNQVTLNDDRSVMFSTATGIVRIWPTKP